MPVKIDIAPEADTVTAMLTGEIDHHGAGRLQIGRASCRERV